MNYSPTDNEQAGRGGGGGAAAAGQAPLLPASIPNPRLVLQPGEHPFPTRYAIERTEMRIEPSIYLDALMNDFLLWGGKVVIGSSRRRATSPRSTRTSSSTAPASESKALFNDPELMPLKGQLTVLIPQSEITYSTSGGARPPATPDAGFVHMMPRSDGIVLGGTSLRDDWSLDVNEKERQRIVDAHIELFSSMRADLPDVTVTASCNVAVLTPRCAGAQTPIDPPAPRSTDPSADSHASRRSPRESAPADRSPARPAAPP